VISWFQPLNLKCDILVPKVAFKFSFYRYTALPHSDFGVRKGVMKLYGLSAMPSQGKMQEVAAAWVGLDTTSHSRYCCAPKHIQSMTPSILVRPCN
jgi:hypothetical protein